MSRVLKHVKSLAVRWLLLAVFSVAACQWTCGAEKPKNPQPRKLRVVVFGAHPDDPESGAGGLIILLSRAGHEVIAAYATCHRGERKCLDRPEADVRREEAEAACKIMGATAKFFPYDHDTLTADAASVKTVSAWFDEVKPDIVVTHWPLDNHPNHHATSSLVWQCYRPKGGWNLYFFEVMAGIQTLAFQPELYLDIGSARATKEQACLIHKSQNPQGFWRTHEQMQRNRGAECGVECAEAYLLVEAKPGCPLLPVRFLPKQHH